jgi:hypothetical protein
MAVKCYQCNQPAKLYPSTGKRGALCQTCICIKSKSYYNINRKHIILKMKQWRAKNRERFNKQSSIRYLTRKKKTVEMYGGKCRMCNETNLAFLVVDHVLDNGAQDRKIWGPKMADIHIWLQKCGYPDTYQVLCGSCNFKKEIERRRKKLSKTWERNQKAKSKVITAYGGKCTCCGEYDQDKLVIDHIHGGGSKEKNSYPARNVYLYLKNLPLNKKKFQVLCQNCNQAKSTLGQCPHKDLPFKL